MDKVDEVVSKAISLLTTEDISFSRVNLAIKYLSEAKKVLKAEVVAKEAPVRARAAEVLAIILQENYITHAEFAELMGVTKSAVDNWSLGNRRMSSKYQARYKAIALVIKALRDEKRLPVLGINKRGVAFKMIQERLGEA